jgi:TonB family protein
MKRTVVALALAAAIGCGGQEGAREDVVEPAPCPECGGGDEGGGATVDDTVIPEEKYEEIRHEFEAKTQTVARCYVEGFEAGEVEKTQKGAVTVSLTINTSGKPENVRIEKSSFNSDAVGQCVVRLVSGWTFPALPKRLDTSHTYVLDRL